MNKLNPFSNEVKNAGNGESGIYTPPCSMIEICGSQADANNAISRGKVKGLTREKSLDFFNSLQAVGFQKRLQAGQVGIKKKSGTDLDNEDLEYRDLW